MAEEFIESDGETIQSPGEEMVEGLPVLAEVRPIEPVPAPPLPAVHAAAVAATGFLAGAATVALVRRRTGRKLARSYGLDLRRPAPTQPPTGAGRTFLVHVRVLGRPDG